MVVDLARNSNISIVRKRFDVETVQYHASEHLSKIARLDILNDVIPERRDFTCIREVVRKNLPQWQHHGKKIKYRFLQIDICDKSFLLTFRNSLRAPDPS